MLDIYQGSKYTKDPSYPKIKQELKTGELFLEHLRKTYKGTRIIYLEGNHDKRMRIYLHNKAPELEGVDVLHLKNMLNLSKHGIEYYNNGTVLQAGGLHLVHGNEFMAGGGSMFLEPYYSGLGTMYSSDTFIKRRSCLRIQFRP